MSKSLVPYSVPFPAPSSVGNILEAVRQILTHGKDVHSVNMEVGLPIRYKVWEDGEGDGGMSVGALARNVELEEVYEGTPEQTLLRAFTLAALHGLYITHIGVGTRTMLWEWLGLDQAVHGRMGMFMNAQIGRDSDIPNEIVLMFAGPFQDGLLEDTKIGYKILARR